MIKAMNNAAGKRSPETKAKPMFRTDFRLGSRFIMLIAVQIRDKMPSGTHMYNHGPKKRFLVRTWSSTRNPHQPRNGQTKSKSPIHPESSRNRKMKTGRPPTWWNHTPGKGDRIQAITKPLE